MTIHTSRPFLRTRGLALLSSTVGFLLLVCMALGIGVLPAAAEEPDRPAPLLTVSSISVEPAELKPDQLCQLRVELTNKGDQIASQLGFAVKLNNQVLGIYVNQLFMYPIEPKATAEFRLYNFWTSESSRPFPANGKLTVEVILNEAQWMQREVEGEVTTWTPLGEVEGLPNSKQIELQ